MSCLFCNINPKEVLFQTDLFVVIANLYPATPGHILVIPKAHVSSISDLDDSFCSELGIVTKKAAKAIEENFQPQGFTFMMVKGKIAGQTQEHLHQHIIPRYEGDGIVNLGRPLGERKMQTREELEKLKEMFSALTI